MIDNAHGTLELSYLALSKLISTFNIDLEGFCKTLKKQHIISTNRIYGTISATALRSGIDRRTVARILADDNIYHKPAFLPIILNRIEELAMDNNNLVAKQGFKSVESIMHDVASGATTLKSIVSTLKKLHCIEEQDNDITFISNRFNMTEHRRLLLQQFSLEFSQWVEQILTDYHQPQ